MYIVADFRLLTVGSLWTNILSEYIHVLTIIITFLENIKLALHVESVEWKRILGKLLSMAYKERVTRLMQFINDRMKTMGKKLKDLDDVRLAMICLELIREEFIGLVFILLSIVLVTSYVIVEKFCFAIYTNLYYRNVITD